MTRRDVLELRILGPLEARLGETQISLGGAKQRSVLATLLLCSDDTVSSDRLIDEVWGESPPASAAHSLEVYISRLRQIFNGYGPSLVRKGAGYSLELGGAALDARRFTDCSEQASSSAAVGDHERATRFAADALALWRGPVVADVTIGASGRAEADRLEELHLRTYEVRFHAGLELGRHEQVVGELQALVGRNPYRERFVALLMLALYRSGRHAEALDVYEQTRRRLDAGLGLQPSTELQQLSAQIVRQEPELRGSAPPVATGHPSEPRPARRISALVLAGAAVATAMALTAGDGAPSLARASIDSETTRIALVFQRASLGDTHMSARTDDLRAGLFDVAAQKGLEAEALALHSPAAADVERVSRRIAVGHFDLVLVAVDPVAARAFAAVLPRLPGTQSIFIDASLAELAPGGLPNASAVRFASEQPSQLAGALSGLVRPYSAAARRADVVSVVAGTPTSETRRVIAAFRRGLAQALPSAKLRIDYSNETFDPTACERIANEQIDGGSDVVLVHAGRCGLGALAVARVRGVWAIGSDGVGRARDNVVGSIFKDWDNAVYTSVHAYLDGALPPGREVVLGLDGYNVGLEMHSSLPPSIASKVVRLCSDIRVRESVPTRSEP